MKPHRFQAVSAVPTIATSLPYATILQCHRGATAAQLSSISWSGASGLTLIELMIATAIASVIVLALVQNYADTAKVYVRNREEFQAKTSAILAGDFIMRELRSAGYIVGWDTNAVSPPIAVNQAITGATVDPNTESLTVRYAQGPLTGAGAPVAVLNGVHNAGGTTLTVQPLTFAISNETLVAIYSPPGTVNVRRVSAAGNVGGTTIALATPYTGNFTTGDVVAIVQESSFWIQSGNLWMRNFPTAGANQQLAANIEDLQIALINADQSVIGDVSSATFAGLTTAQLLNARAVRLSLTARSSRPLLDRPAEKPPSLEDHNRSGEPADQIRRAVEQTTVYLRNFGALDP